MSLKDGASSRRPGSARIDDANWPRWEVLIRVVHRLTRSPSPVTTPISAIRFSAGLKPVVSTSTIARRVKGSKVGRRSLHHCSPLIIERTFDNVQLNCTDVVSRNARQSGRRRAPFRRRHSQRMEATTELNDMSFFLLRSNLVGQPTGLNNFLTAEE